MSALDVADVRALTFDCYGTLVDWDRGVADAVGAMPSLAGVDRAAFVRARELAEREVEAGDYLPYGEVLRRSLARAAEAVGREPTADELDAFAESVGDWPAFDESPACLARLAERFSLGLLSNIETATLERSVATLGAPFAALVTAEEVRSYKPAHAHFEEGLRRLDLPREAVLHVAQSHFHDVVPAKALGWRVVWVNRLGEALPAGGPAPDLEVASLSELLEALG